MIGSKAKGRAYASQMPVPRKRYFVKRTVRAGRRDHAKDAAAEEPAAGRVIT
jgi:hypothetical protein